MRYGPAGFGAREEEKVKFDDLIYQKKDHIATITLHNPEKLNAITGRMLASFSRAIELVSEDDDVRVLVLTGTGRGFCTAPTPRC